MGKTEGGKERMYSFCIKLVHFFFSGNPREAMICLSRFLNASLPNCYGWVSSGRICSCLCQLSSILFWGKERTLVSGNRVYRN